ATLRDAASRLGAAVVAASPANAAAVVTARSPSAGVVAADVYRADGLALDRAALEVGADLLVSSDEFYDRQLEALLDGALSRRRGSSYEKGAILDGRYELLRDLGGRLPGSRWEVRHVQTSRRSRLKIG